MDIHRVMNLPCHDQRGVIVRAASANGNTVSRGDRQNDQLGSFRVDSEERECSSW